MVQIDVNEQLFQKIGSESECQMFVVFHAYVYLYVELGPISQWVDQLMIEVSWKCFCCNFDYNDMIQNLVEICFALILIIIHA